MLLLLASIFAHADCDPPRVWPADGQVDVPMIHQAVYWKWDADSPCQVHDIRMWEVESGEENWIGAGAQTGKFTDVDRDAANVTYAVEITFNEGPEPDEYRDETYQWQFTSSESPPELGRGTFSALELTVNVEDWGPDGVTATTTYTGGHPADLIKFRRSDLGVVDWVDAADLGPEGRATFSDFPDFPRFHEQCWEAYVIDPGPDLGPQTPRECYTRG